MTLPKSIWQCIERLEKQGFSCYAVGGCVRDSLLGLIPQDYDLCTDALPEQMKTVFADYTLVLAGEKHGTVGVVIDGEVIQITTFRTEGDYADSRHPGWVSFVKTVEGDLSRRDFTINAMAYHPSQGLVDPFGGRADLQQRILRAVGDASARFSEDALRILRGVRFAVRYGLTPEQDTLQGMLQQAPLLENIAKERIFEELCKLLPLITAEDLLCYAPILFEVMPELAPTMGFQQHSPYHTYDIFTHTAHVTAAVDKDLALRWAALLHDVGKVSTFTQDEDGHGHFYGHAEVSAELANEILLRLKAPTALREEVVFLITHHMTPLIPERKALRRRLSKWGAERLQKLLALQHADFNGKGIIAEPFPFEEIQALLADILEENSCLTRQNLAINGRDLTAMGYQGAAVGKCLDALLLQVVDEELPNEKAALLAAAERMKL